MRKSRKKLGEGVQYIRFGFGIVASYNIYNPHTLYFWHFFQIDSRSAKNHRILNSKKTTVSAYMRLSCLFTAF